MTTLAHAPLSLDKEVMRFILQYIFKKKKVYKCSGTTEMCRFNSVSYQVRTQGSKKVC